MRIPQSANNLCQSQWESGRGCSGKMATFQLIEEDLISALKAKSQSLLRNHVDAAFRGCAEWCEAAGARSTHQPVCRGMNLIAWGLCEPSDFTILHKQTQKNLTKGAHTHTNWACSFMHVGRMTYRSPDINLSINRDTEMRSDRLLVMSCAQVDWTAQ